MLQQTAPRLQPPKSRSAPKYKQRAVEIESNGSESGSLSHNSDDRYKCTSATSKHHPHKQKRKHQCRRRETSVEEVEVSTRDDGDTEVVEVGEDENENDGTLTGAQNELNEESTDGAPMTEGQSVS